jgi:hypothetical protein
VPDITKLNIEIIHIIYSYKMYELMLITLYIFIIFFHNICVNARNTKVYQDYWHKIGNSNYIFFDSNTLGYQVFSDPCQIIEENSEFRAFINLNRECHGQWCNNDKFICGRSHGQTDCYHVEHIIDRNGPEFTNCGNCKSIAGNMIMAWGRWNKALGGVAKNYYNDSQSEKIEVYGQNIIDNAKYWISYCTNKVQHDSNDEILALCNEDTECNCEVDSYCGCDCDFELEQSILDSKYAIIIVAISVCLIYISLFLYHNKTIKLHEEIPILTHTNINVNEDEDTNNTSESEEKIQSIISWNDKIIY